MTKIEKKRHAFLPSFYLVLLKKREMDLDFSKSDVIALTEGEQTVILARHPSSILNAPGNQVEEFQWDSHTLTLLCNKPLLPHYITELVSRGHLNANARTRSGTTVALTLVRRGADISLFESLFNNAELDIAATSDGGWTLADHLIYQDKYDILQYMIAFYDTVPITAHREFTGPVWRCTFTGPVWDLMTRYKSDRQRVRTETRRLLWFYPDISQWYSAILFAHVVLYSDGYTRPIDDHASHDMSDGIRLLNIFKRLPLEIQMHLCQKLMCLLSDLITTPLVEEALRHVCASLG